MSDAGVTTSEPQVTHSEPIVSVGVRERIGRDTQLRLRVELIGDNRVEVFNWQQSATWRMNRALAEGLRDALIRVLAGDQREVD